MYKGSVENPWKSMNQATRHPSEHTKFRTVKKVDGTVPSKAHLNTQESCQYPSVPSNAAMDTHKHWWLHSNLKPLHRKWSWSSHPKWHVANMVRWLQIGNIFAMSAWESSCRKLALVFVPCELYSFLCILSVRNLNKAVLIVPSSFSDSLPNRAAWSQKSAFSLH